MKRNNILLLTVFILSISAFSLSAQTPERKMNMKDFEKRKMEYITKEAGLTQDEASKYFPLSNELAQKKFEMHRSFRAQAQNLKKGDMSDEEYRKLLDSDVNIRLKEAELEKEYSSKFEKVLPPQKLYQAQQAEKSFMQIEVSKFREERGNSQNRGNRR